MMNVQHFAVGQIHKLLKLMFKNIHLFSGAFLIPYAICLVTSGLPVFLLELGLGQYMNTGSIGAWRIVPGLQGKSMEFRGRVSMGKHGWMQKTLVREGERVLITYF